MVLFPSVSQTLAILIDMRETVWKKKSHEFWWKIFRGRDREDKGMDSLEETFCILSSGGHICWVAEA